MSLRGTALAVQKNAERWQAECELSVNLQIALLLTSFVCAVGAAVASFAGTELLDRTFSIGVLATLGVETVLYGMTHWRGQNNRASRYGDLARFASRVADGEAESTAADLFDREQNLGDPHSSPIVRWYVNRRIMRRWGASGPPNSPIYDSRQHCVASDFNFHQSKTHPENEPGKIAGQGTFNVDSGVIDIRRSNREGRVRLQLRRYVWNGSNSEALPQEPHASGSRWLDLSFEAKAPDGKHTVVAMIKRIDNQRSICDRSFEVTSPSWRTFSARFKITRTADVELFIDDFNTAESPGTLQLKNLFLVQL